MAVEVAQGLDTRLKNRVARKGHPAASRAFEWGVLFTGGCVVLGGYADAWAHGHTNVDTFFTPWHGVLYTGVLLVMVFFGATIVRNWLKGYSLNRAVPAGYQLSLLGALLFPFGGMGDMTWHLIFGIETGLDAALSPTHLLMALAFGLVVSGPLRGRWRSREANQTYSSQVPMLVSICLTISTFTLIMQQVHPAIKLPMPSSVSSRAADLDNMLTIVGIIVMTTIYMGFILLAVRRWQLLPGSLTIILLPNLTLLSFMRDNYLIIAAGLVIGLILDALLYFLKPSTNRAGMLHLFGFLMPVATFLVYFLTLMMVGRLNWSIHLWLGSTAVTGLTGWLVSYLILPPPLPIGEN